MKKLLLSAVALLAMTMASNADTVSFLGPNPTSGAGAFSNTDPGSVLLAAVPVQQGGSGVASLGGAFVDIYNFSLTTDQVLTITFATNTFAGGAPQMIANFTGAVVYEGADGQIGGGDDQVLFGPEAAVPCVAIPNCQVFGGSASLDAGEYHLRITGSAGVDAGYGGNISTFAVPGPIVGAGIPGILALMGMVGFGTWRKRKQT